MKEHNLTRRQILLISELVKGGEIQAACLRAGVSRGSYHQWQKLPEFRAALREAELELLDGITRQLSGLAATAILALADGCASTEATPHRLRAAELILTQALRFREAGEIEERLTALESEVHSDTKFTN
jgi:hypothetical protein